MVTDEQWEKINAKYSGLLWKISHNISGDKAIAHIEDNYAELQIVALEAVAGFEKKTGKSFDIFWGEKLFDQYIKTCLWNYKNSKGARIAQRYSIHRDVVSTNKNAQVFQIADESISEFDLDIYLEEISSSFNDQQKEVLDLLLRCPSAVKANGTVNKSKIAKKLNKPWNEINNIVDSLEKVLDF